MGKTAVLIGAGPAGLTAALELLRRTDIHPIVLEASGEIGGISRTIRYKGNRMDIGGHRFFSKSDRVMQWWMDLMPPALNEAQEISYQGQRRLVTVPAHPPEEPPLRGLGPLQHEVAEVEDAVDELEEQIEHEDEKLLILRVADAPGRMRQKRIVAIGPQMRVERIGALLRRRLHDDAPAALQQFFQERRQHGFERHVLQMVEQNFRHFLAS